MGVKCDHCDKEATVHDIAIVKGKKEERHLCEDHAKEMGVIPGVWHSGVGHLVQSVVLSKSGAAAQRSSSEQACPSCGLTFGEFRKEGLLGCAECYTAFEDRLGPLLERAHEGGGHHTGKVPRRAGASLERQQQLGSLRRSLQHAIDHEQYENAARLRDEIASLENGTRDPRSESPANRIQSGDAAPDDIDARDDVSSRPPRPGD
jgi:protein arginine kinase activator